MAVKFLVVNTDGLISTSADKNGHVVIKAESKDYKILDWGEFITELYRDFAPMNKEQKELLKHLLFTKN